MRLHPVGQLVAGDAGGQLGVFRPAGAVQLVVSVLAMRNGVVPPTINYSEPDPDCDLDYVPGSAREMRVRNALSNSLGFGGHNVSICVGQVG